MICGNPSEFGAKQSWRAHSAVRVMGCLRSKGEAPPRRSALRSERLEAEAQQLRQAQP
jgi:hypothetical protein